MIIILIPELDIVRSRGRSDTRNPTCILKPGLICFFFKKGLCNQFPSEWATTD
eukprot:SAG31_NODE_26236_length_446_cov_0.538905_1_plen_52_part_01